MLNNMSLDVTYRGTKLLIFQLCKCSIEKLYTCEPDDVSNEEGASTVIKSPSKDGASNFHRNVTNRPKQCTIYIFSAGKASYGVLRN